MSIIQRIEECQHLMGLPTLNALALKLGMPPPNLYKLRKDPDRSLSLDSIAIISAGCRISPVWLLYGKGPRDLDEYERLMADWEKGHAA